MQWMAWTKAISNGRKRKISSKTGYWCDQWVLWWTNCYNRRWTVARNCFLGAGIPLFGSNIGGKVCGYGIYTQANDGYVTELGIVRTLLEYGPIVFGLFCAFMLIAVWVLYKKGYFGAMVLLEIGFIACGVEAYFPAAYNLKAFVFGLAFYQLMGLFKGKEKEEKRGKAVNASE